MVAVRIKKYKRHVDQRSRSVTEVIGVSPNQDVVEPISISVSIPSVLCHYLVITIYWWQYGKHWIVLWRYENVSIISEIAYRYHSSTYRTRFVSG